MTQDPPKKSLQERLLEKYGGEQSSAPSQPPAEQQPVQQAADPGSLQARLLAKYGHGAQAATSDPVQQAAQQPPPPIASPEEQAIERARAGVDLDSLMSIRPTASESTSTTAKAPDATEKQLVETVKKSEQKQKADDADYLRTIANNEAVFSQPPPQQTDPAALAPPIDPRKDKIMRDYMESEDAMFTMQDIQQRKDAGAWGVPEQTNLEKQALSYQADKLNQRLAKLMETSDRMQLDKRRNDIDQRTSALRQEAEQMMKVREMVDPNSREAVESYNAALSDFQRRINTLQADRAAFEAETGPLMKEQQEVAAGFEFIKGYVPKMLLRAASTPEMKEAMTDQAIANVRRAEIDRKMEHGRHLFGKGGGTFTERLMNSTEAFDEYIVRPIGREILHLGGNATAFVARRLDDVGNLPATLTDGQRLYSPAAQYADHVAKSVERLTWTEPTMDKQELFDKEWRVNPAWLPKLAKGAVYMAAVQAAGAAGGVPAMMGASVALMSEDYYQEGMQEGLKPVEAERFALMMGMWEGIVEQFNKGPFVKDSGIRRELARKAVKAVKSGKTMNHALDELMGYSLKQGVWEGAEEIATGIGQAHTKHLTNLAFGSKFEVIPTLQQTAEEFLMGFALGGLMGGSSRISTRPAFKEALAWATSSEQNQQAVRDYIAESAGNEQEKAKLNDQFDTYVRVAKGLDAIGVEEQVREDLLALSVEKEQLLKEQKDTYFDPQVEAAYGEEINGRIKEIDNEIAAILKLAKPGRVLGGPTAQASEERQRKMSSFVQPAQADEEATQEDTAQGEAGGEVQPQEQQADVQPEQPQAAAETQQPVEDAGTTDDSAVQQPQSVSRPGATLEGEDSPEPAAREGARAAEELAPEGEPPGALPEAAEPLTEDELNYTAALEQGKRLFLADEQGSDVMTELESAQDIREAGALGDIEIVDPADVPADANIQTWSQQKRKRQPSQQQEQTPEQRRVESGGFIVSEDAEGNLVVEQSPNFKEPKVKASKHRKADAARRNAIRTRRTKAIREFDEKYGTSHAPSTNAIKEQRKRQEAVATKIVEAGAASASDLALKLIGVSGAQVSSESVRREMYPDQRGGKLSSEHLNLRRLKIATDDKGAPSIEALAESMVAQYGEMVGGADIEAPFDVQEARDAIIDALGYGSRSAALEALEERYGVGGEASPVPGVTMRQLEQWADEAGVDIDTIIASYDETAAEREEATDAEGRGRDQEEDDRDRQGEEGSGTDQGIDEEIPPFSRESTPQERGRVTAAVQAVIDRVKQAFPGVDVVTDQDAFDAALAEAGQDAQFQMDPDRAKLTAEVQSAQRALDKATKDFNNRALDLFAADQQTELDTGADSSQENFDRITAPLRAAVEQAKKKLADYDRNKGIAESQQTTLFSRSSNDIEAEANRLVDGWYSRLDDTVKAKGNTMSGAQWGKWLEARAKDGMMSMEEAKWTGLSDWLAGKAGEKVTPQQVREFLKENRVKVEVFVNSNHPQSQTTDTRFDEYQLPGGTNYREVLVTLPRRAHPLEGEIRALGITKPLLDVSAKDIEIAGGSSALQSRWMDSFSGDRFGNDFQSSHFDEPNILVHLRLNDRTDADGKKVLFIEEIQSDWAQKGRREGFNRKWTKEEVAMDVYQRPYETMDEADRSAVDSETEGRNEGTGGANPSTSGAAPLAPFVTSTNTWVELGMKQAIRMAAEGGYDRIAWTTGEQQAKRYDLSQRVDKITWGAVAENELTDIPAPDGTKTVAIEFSGDEGRLGIFVDEQGKVVDGWDGDLMWDEVIGRSLDEVVGKEIADKIMSEGGGNLSGEGLKVGGKGMVAFYDSILPKVAGKVAKRLGGNGAIDGIAISAAERVNISPRNVPGGTIYDLSLESGPMLGSYDSMAEAEAYVARRNSEKQTTQQSIAITDSTRELVSAGVPLFSTSGGNVMGFFRQGRVYLNPSAVRPDTPIHEFGHVWMLVAKNMAPRVFQAGLSLAKRSPYFDIVKRDPDYKHLPDDQIAEEALARMIGEKGEQMLKTQRTAWQRFWKNLWDAIKTGLRKLGIETGGLDYDNATFEDFANAVAGELLSTKPVSSVTTEMLEKLSSGSFRAGEIPIESTVNPNSLLKDKKKSKLLDYFRRKTSGTGGNKEVFRVKRDIDSKYARNAEEISMFSHDLAAAVQEEIKDLPTKAEKDARATELYREVHDFLGRKGEGVNLPDGVMAMVDKYMEATDATRRQLQANDVGASYDVGMSQNLTPYLTRNFEALEQFQGWLNERIAETRQVQEEYADMTHDQLLVEADRNDGRIKAARKRLLKQKKVSLQAMLNALQNSNRISIAPALQQQLKKINDLIAQGGGTGTSTKADKATKELRKEINKLKDQILDEQKKGGGLTEEEADLYEQIDEAQAVLDEMDPLTPDVMNTEQLTAHVQRQAERIRLIEAAEERAKLRDMTPESITWETLTMDGAANVTVIHANGERTTFYGLPRATSRKLFGPAIEGRILTELKGSADVPGKLLMNDKLYERMAQNAGFYVNRSYRAHLDPNWKNRFEAVIGPEGMAKIRAFVGQRLGTQRVSSYEIVNTDGGSGVYFINEAGVRNISPKSSEQLEGLKKKNGGTFPNEYIEEVQARMKANDVGTHHLPRTIMAQRRDRLNFQVNAQAAIQGFIDGAVTKDGSGALLSGLRVSGVETGIFRRRKELPEEIRILLGEVVNGRITLPQTMLRMSNALAEQTMLQRLVADNMGTAFVKPGPQDQGPPKTHPAELTKAQLPFLAPGEKLYATQAAADIISNSGRKAAESRFWQSVALFSMMAKSMVTVADPSSNARNFVGAQIMLWRAGYFGGIGDIKYATSVLSQNYGKAQDVGTLMTAPLFLMRVIAGKNFGRSGKGGGGKYSKEAMRERYLRFVELGLAREGANIGMLDDLRRNSDPLFRAQFDSRAANWVSDKAAKAWDAITPQYAMSDELPKFIAWQKETQTQLKNDPNLNPNKKEDVAEAEYRAAKIIERILPTYSLNPQFVKSLSKSPVLGTFVNFAYANYRSIWEIGQLSKQEALQGGKAGKLRAARRMGALATTIAIPMAIGMLMRALLGWDDDEEAAVSDGLAEYEANNLRIPVNNNPQSPQYLDLQYMDPNAPAYGPMVAFARERKRGRGLLQSSMSALDNGLSQFYSLELFFKAVVDALGERDPRTGRRYRSMADPRRLSPVTRAMTPGLVKRSADMYKSIMGEERVYGGTTMGKYSLMEEGMNWAIGTKLRNRDMEFSYKTRFKDLKNELSDVRYEYKRQYREATDGKNMTDQEKEAKRNELYADYGEEWMQVLNEMRRYDRNLKVLGFDSPQDRIDIIKDGGVGEELARAIVFNQKAYMGFGVETGNDSWVGYTPSFLPEPTPDEF